MRKSRLTAVLIVLSLLTLPACDQSKADRFILAVEAARALPAVFGVTGEQAELVSDGFGVVASAARAVRDGKGTWEALVQTFREVRGRPSWRRLDGRLRERVEAVWALAEALLDAARPSLTRSMSRPDFGRADEAGLRELERLTGRRK
jgi:hypothetical protein